MNRTLTLTATAVAVAALWTLQVVRAQGESTAAGIYTDEQAKRGEAVYKEKCASCHGEDLKGNEIIPGLTGDTFATNWRGKTVGDLFDKISMTMPALDPGSLSPEQTSELIAHMLSASKYPAGKTALPTTMDALSTIKIDEPK